MTDTIETNTVEQSGEQLLTEMRAFIRGEQVDLDAAVAAFARAASGVATDESLAEVRRTVPAIVSKYRQWAGHNGVEVGQRMGYAQMHQLAAAIDAAVSPFGRADDLAAAERELDSREQDAQQALADLEAAVAAADVQKVMQLRGEVEVGHPGRIAEARKALLKLQIEREQARVRPAEIREGKARAATMKARQHLADLTNQVKAAEQAVTLAHMELDSTQTGRQALVDEMRRRQAELSDLETNHDREMQARLRRIAGLPELVAPVETERGPTPHSLMMQQINPVAGR